MRYECTVCKEAVDTSEFSRSVALRLEDHRICFGCSYWCDRVILVSSGDLQNIAIANGSFYVLRDNVSRDTRGPCVGSGGVLFRIEYQDGRVVYCNNLWCNGEIPPRWKFRLRDNASLRAATNAETATFWQQPASFTR